MVGPVARYCIKRWLAGSKTLIDPFVGSGSVLVEASILGKKSIGIDLNPLAVMMSRAKTEKLDDDRLANLSNTIVSTISDLVHSSWKEKYEFKEPHTVTNWEGWYKKDHIHALQVIKAIIDENIEDQSYKNYFYLPLSELSREASYQRNGEFKRYRIPKEDRQDFTIDVFETYLAKLKRNRSGYNEYLSLIERQENFQNPELRLQDSRYLDWIEDNSIDGLLTSPPYGDSGTTVAYGQFSRFTLEFLEIEDMIKPNQLDSLLLGGRRSEYSVSLDDIDSPTLDATIDLIRKKDEKRAQTVENFFLGYFEAIKEFSRVLKQESTVVFVVGNRTVKGIWIETDMITKEMFEHFDYKLKGIYIRDIPNKRMPSKNSPTNIKGEKVTTMVNEFIVVMERDQ